MECLFEIFLPLFGEAFLGAGFEFVAEVIGRFFGWIYRLVTGQAIDASPDGRRRLGRFLLWTLAGVAFGLLSLWLFPRPIVRVPFLQIVNIIVTPLAMAGAMIAWEQWLSKWRGRRSPGAAEFVNRYAFALCYLLVRFFFAARGAA